MLCTSPPIASAKDKVKFSVAIDGAPPYYQTHVIVRTREELHRSSDNNE